MSAKLVMLAGVMLSPRDDAGLIETASPAVIATDASVERLRLRSVVAKLSGYILHPQSKLVFTTSVALSTAKVERLRRTPISSRQPRVASPASKAFGVGTSTN